MNPVTWQEIGRIRAEELRRVGASPSRRRRGRRPAGLRGRAPGVLAPLRPRTGLACDPGGQLL